MTGDAASMTRTNSGDILAWAVYLGTSWTWCIGMFLPVILVREMGLWGWIVFAIPNVVGAAAMGWVLRTADASERLVRDHRPACIAFSAVTVAFHVFFLGWLIGSRMLGIGWMLAGAGLGIATIALLVRRSWGHAAAWAALVVSVAVIAVSKRTHRGSRSVGMSGPCSSRARALGNGGPGKDTTPVRHSSRTRPRE